MVRARPRCAIPANRADKYRVDSRLGALPQRQAVRQHLDAATVRQWHVDRHIAQEDIGGYPSPPSRQTLAAARSRGAARGPKTPAVGHAAL